MRWRLIIEEFSPELIYLKGERNIVADALSRLQLQNSDVPSTKMHDLHYLAEHFALEDEDLQSDAFPVHYKLIAQHQSHQKEFFTKHTQDYHLKSFRGGGMTHILVCRNEKIVIPTTLQRRVVTWYHDILCHAGETRTEQTLKQQYWWPNLRCLTAYTMSAQNAMYVNALSALPKNTDNCLLKKRKLIRGKCYA